MHGNNVLFSNEPWINIRLDKTKYVHLSSSTWNYIPSLDRTTVHSNSITEFTSRFPSDIPREIAQNHSSNNNNIHKPIIRMWRNTNK